MRRNKNNWNIRYWIIVMISYIICIIACCLLPVACCLLPVAFRQFSIAELQVPEFCPEKAIFWLIIGYIVLS